MKNFQTSVRTIYFPFSRILISKTLVLFSALTSTVFLNGCGGSDSDADIEYVALGASDTIGVGVTPITNAYPFLIKDELENGGKETDLINLGIPSAEVDEIRELELGIAVEEDPDLVTLTVGPNDLVSGTTAESFETELAEVFQELREDTQAFVVVATIPDITQSPRFIDEPDPDVTVERINAFNAAILRQADAYQIPVADLRSYQVSGEVTAEDGFHPNDEGQAIIAAEFLKVITPRFLP